MCVCVREKFYTHSVCSVSSSPLSINFSIFDGIAHAHHWFHCKFRRTNSPRSTKKFFLQYTRALRTEWERTYSLHFQLQKGDGAIIKFQRTSEKKLKKIKVDFVCFSQFLKSTNVNFLHQFTRKKRSINWGNIKFSSNQSNFRHTGKITTKSLAN